MNCPTCGKYLAPEFHLTITTTNFQEFQDVDFTCGNGHVYFVRIKPDDLIETATIA